MSEPSVGPTYQQLQARIERDNARIVELLEDRIAMRKEIERLKSEVKYEQERNEANVAAAEREIERLEGIIFRHHRDELPINDWVAEVYRIAKKREGR